MFKNKFFVWFLDLEEARKIMKSGKTGTANSKFRKIMKSRENGTFDNVGREFGVIGRAFLVISMPTFIAI